MQRLSLSFSLLLVAASFGEAQAEPRVVCTLAVAADSAAPLVKEGRCGDPVTPASTFKIAIALMGFDAGVLVSPDAPKLPYQPVYAAGRAEWRQAQTPATWMRDSVIWYSQEVTKRLGAARFAAYAAAFDYGNRDVSGDWGKGNGLTHAWLGTSLKISPEQQVAFLRRVTGETPPVSADAVAKTKALIDQGVLPSGWHLYGKTGSWRRADGAIGWFVGWAERDGRRVIFARQIHQPERGPQPTGYIARDGVLADLFGPNGRLN
jgi:beta-lactamase class D